ncbi:MAG: ABC transporter ATP-binding protein [Firmicutes bacterium]|nr:ABC transporter ATP-binding protein [Bacillota bacterium]
MLRLLKYLRPYRGYVVLVLALTFLQALSTLYLPELMAHIVDTGIVEGRVHYIIRVGLIMLAVTILGGVAAVGAALFASQSAAGFGKILRSLIFRHVESFGLREFDLLGTSSLIVRTTNDVMQVQQLVNMMLRMMILAPLTSIGGIIMAIHTNGRLALSMVVVIPLLGVTVWGVLSRGIPLFRVVQTKVDRLNRIVRENLAGVRVVRAFHQEDYERQRFYEANLDLTDTSVRVFQMMALMMPLVMLIMNWASVAIFWWGSLRLSHGALEVGALMAFIQYFMQIMFAVMMVSMMAFMLPRGQASALRILEVLDTEVDIREDQKASVLLTPPVTELTFDHVTFYYPGAEEPALADITFKARAGETVAIIGGTGAGKSTLLNLIPRFYDVKSGSIRLNNIDIRDLPLSALRAEIGLVPQRPVLFSGSILDNVRYGNLTASEAEAMHALDVAQAWPFVSQMPGGLHQEINQGGANLSGGQRQRLAIARALVRQPSVYLFDDSFSALDYKTDAALRQALRRETGSAIVLLVAQRVATIMDADRILVLEDGRLVGQGTHAELMETSAVYREIVASQLSPEEIA